MKSYDHKKIEKKWQKRWEADGLYTTQDSVEGKENFYTLVEYPYPSGNLHTGHWYAFAVPDIFARYKRMKGYNVLFPIGFDSFGLPAENAAIKNKVDPREWTYQNIDTMTAQIKSMGAMFDWSREVRTSDENYYKWTQWLFLELYKKDIAYQKEAVVNWDPVDQTVLANEQVLSDGTAERSGAVVEKKKLTQWFFKITDYADRLLEDLDELKWPEQIKQAQRAWIGKKEGAEIEFPIAKKYRFVLLHGFTGTPENNFFPWLKEKLKKDGHEVVSPLLPNTNNPTEEEWVSAALSASNYDENTIIFGHSLGAVTALKVVEKLKTKVAGLVLAGGFVDPYFKDNPRNFEDTFKWTFDTEKIRKNSDFISILHDKNDDAVSEEQASRLGTLLKESVTYIDAEDSHFCGKQEPSILRAVLPSIKVFTTRPDTLFGATYMVLAPEHELVERLKNKIENWSEVEKYIKQTEKRTELDRQKEGKEKTGVEIKGVRVINPALYKSGKQTEAEIPIFIADYILSGYGTGAIMAVPAHDKRDFAFAKKFNLPIKEVVLEEIGTESPDDILRDGIMGIIRNKSGDMLIQYDEISGMYRLPGGGIDEGESLLQALKREIIEETGYTDFTIGEYVGSLKVCFPVRRKKITQRRILKVFEIILNSEKQQDVEWSDDEELTHTWMDLSSGFQKLKSNPFELGEAAILDRYISGELAYTGRGILIDSEKFDGLSSEEAKEKITEFVGGEMKSTYRLRDWLISRQRYWGAPIPIVYDPQGKAHPVPQEHLPWILPTDVNFKPMGVAPLARSKELQKRVEKIFGKGWTPEVDTMDTFVDSSWYFLRYTDSQNDKEFASKSSLKKWLPVRRYSGGAEHTTMHVLYSRFFYKALYDLGLVNEKEPYIERTNRGLILGTDGRKMSKRWGNVIDPDVHVKNLGADAVRMYLAFIGPYNIPGNYPWDIGGLVGIRRFLEKIVGASENVEDSTSDNVSFELNKTIKKVGEDITAFKFNTAISQLMILLNLIGDRKEKNSISKADFETITKLLAPFAPHLCEEIWEKMGNKDSIHLAQWPQYDELTFLSYKMSIVVQINGKKRGILQSSSGSSKEEILSLLKENKNLSVWLNGDIKKVIYVENKLINIVL